MLRRVQVNSIKWWQFVVIFAGVVILVGGSAAIVTQPWNESNLFGDESENSQTEQFLETGGDLVSVFGLPVTIVGLLFVLVQQARQGRTRRREQSPLVRIDVVPADSANLTDMVYPDAYYSSMDDIVELDSLPGDQSIVAYFRNVQTHALGAAFDVKATFLVVFRMSGRADRVGYRTVEIPYVVNGRPVCLGLVRFPANSNVSVRLASYRYSDLYTGERALPVEDEGIHGRLACRFANGRYEATPEFWPNMRAVEEAALQDATGS